NVKCQVLSDKCQVLSDHNSPSKIDQWCKPKPAAKLVLALVRRSPLMLKERAEEFQNDINNSSDYD
ncbi:MAG: hypothetical protein II691_02990, partial [Muribaculaceae bacterium]|nr:hypothetical protein [Muribaculaceae bacterium]